MDYWAAIAERHGLDLTVVNPLVDPTWRFMTLDWDGKIRMDCSSPSAMASLVGRKDEFQIATGNDADADRHGIVTPDGGLMNPNHFLAVAIAYLLSHRPGWAAETAVGKTLVSSSLIDRVVADLGRQLLEVAGRLQVVRAGPARRLGRVRRGGVRRGVLPPARRQRVDDGQGRHPPGPARLGDPGRDGPVPSALHRQLTDHFGESAYARIDAPATGSRRRRWASSRPTTSPPPSWPVSRSWPS